MKSLVTNLLIRPVRNMPIPFDTSIVSNVILDVRAYGFSSAVSALLRDLRD